MNNIQAVIAPKLKRSINPYNHKGEVVYINLDRMDGTVSVAREFNGYDVFDVLKEDLSPVRKVVTPISHFSETRAKENKIYLTLRKVFLECHPNCEANLPGCTKQATTIHHSQGRIGKRLVDVKTFVPLCGKCHMWAESHPDEAKELGLSLNRL